jgi:hypothetical protein
MSDRSLRCDAGGQTGRYFVLDGEDIVDVPIAAFGPELLAGFRR